MTTGPEYVSPAQVARALDITPRAVHKRAKKERWAVKVINKRGDKRFRTDALPEDVRAALSISVPAARESRSLYNKDRNIPPFVGSPDLTEAQNRVALARADLIRAYLTEKETAKASGASITAAATDFMAGYNTGKLLPGVWEILGRVSRPSVDRWVKTWRDADFDYAALAPRYGNRRGDRKLSEDEINTALSFALHPNRLRIAQVTRLTKLALEKRGIPSPSSEATLRRALEDWRKQHYDQWVFVREGEKALNDKCLPYLERDIGLLDVGEVLVADGHVLNFEVLHPFTGRPCRMSMVLWYDWASCMPVGWEIMPTEDVQCIAAGLRRAILALGKVPRVAYLDNGKAFKARIFTDPDIDFEEAGFYGMFARLGIETLFAMPYNAQAKVVERFFGTFNELERLMPTYTGASIADKPARLLRNEKLHKRLHEKKYGGWVPTIEEANRIISGWVSEYAARPHRGLKGLAPGEVLKSGLGPGVDEQALRHLMMAREIKGVHRNGIRFLGRNYYDDALYGYRDRVMIKYDLEDLSNILVYDRTGAKFLCSARPVKAVHPVARISGAKDDLAAVKEGLRAKRALKRGTESTARAYIERAPALIDIPLRESTTSAPREKGPRALPRGEAEAIEAAASRMKVLEMKPRRPDPVYMSEADRYEALLERECAGEGLDLDDMQFMRYFEGTEIYRSLRDRFDFLREQLLLEAGGEG